MLPSRLFRLYLPLIIMLAVSACGVKPGELWSPKQIEETKVQTTKKAPAPNRSYPATYPDVRSDPPPPPVAVQHNMPPL